MPRRRPRDTQLAGHATSEMGSHCSTDAVRDADQDHDQDGRGIGVPKKNEAWDSKACTQQEQAATRLVRKNVKKRDLVGQIFVFGPVVDVALQLRAESCNLVEVRHVSEVLHLDRQRRPLLRAATATSRSIAVAYKHK